MAPLEYPVKRVLGHSLRQDADGMHDLQYLIDWDGVDEDGNPYPPSWEDFLDVGMPLIAAFTHRLAMGYPRLAHRKPDGYIYLYADNWAQEHIPRPSVTKSEPAKKSEAGKTAEPVT